MSNIEHTEDFARGIDDSAWRELVLRESPFDPVADLPVRRLVSMQYDEGTTESNGRVLRSVPGEWLLPCLHQRYDDPSAKGLEVALQAEPGRPLRGADRE